MALGEAKVKAKAEFEQCLKSSGKSLQEIHEYVDEHSKLKRRRKLTIAIACQPSLRIEFSA